jgi:uncharacterized membrane protein YbaN (DUF454 family)
VPDEDARPHPIIERLQARRERHRVRSRLYRIVFAAVGFALLTVGLAGLALPVLPGWPLLIVGLTLLALEFAWAERMLERAVDRMERVRQVTVEATRWQRVFGALALAAALGAIAAAAVYWDVPLLPF